MSHDGDTNMYENVPEEIRNAEVSEIQMRKRMLENEIRMMRSEFMRLEHDDAREARMLHGVLRSHPMLRDLVAS